MGLNRDRVLWRGGVAVLQVDGGVGCERRDENTPRPLVLDSNFLNKVFKFHQPRHRPEKTGKNVHQEAKRKGEYVGEKME